MTSFFSAKLFRSGSATENTRAVAYMSIEYLRIPRYILITLEGHFPETKITFHFVCLGYVGIDSYNFQRLEGHFYTNFQNKNQFQKFLKLLQI